MSVVEQAVDLAERPVDLWRRAHDEAGGHREARLTLFRHSMIHAGFLTTSKGARYKRCPMCHIKLA